MNQRHLCKKHDAGKRCHGMNADRIKLLEDIGFNWTVRDAHWDGMYDTLKEFKTKHGHTNVSTHDPNNKVSVLQVLL
jgi:hypothetical protein